MKFILTLILAASYLICLAQVTPPDLNFNTITEKWKYIYFDPNFPVDVEDPSASPYSHRVPVKYIIDDNLLYLLETKVSPNPYGGIEGSILHNINLNTGQSNWIDYNTSFLNLDYRVDITNSEMYLDDNSITFTGYRDLNSIDYTQPNIFGFYGTPMKRTVDKNTGELINEKYGINTPSGLIYSVPGSTTKIIRTEDNGFSNISADLITNKGTLKNVYDFYELDEDFDYTYKISDSIIYDSGLQTSLSQLSYKSLFRIYNNKMLCLFGTKNPADTQLSPDKLFLNWYDISNSEDVSEIRSIDVIGDIYYPQDLYSPIKLNIKDNNIILYQELFFSTESPEPNNEFVWLSWYDIEGNRIAHLDPVHTSDRYYPAITVLGVKDGSLYIAGGYRENSTEGYDILRIEPGENNYTRVGEISIPTSNTIDYGISKAQILPDGDVFIAIGLDYDFNSTTFTFYYYYRFDGSTLGILTDTKDEQLSQADLLVYPNPAKENTRLKFNEKVSGQLKLINSIGQEVYISTVDLVSEYHIDLSQYPSGIYTVIFIDEQSNDVQKSKFIVVE